MLEFRLSPKHFEIIGFVLYSLSVVIGLGSLIVATSDVLSTTMSAFVGVVGVGFYLGFDRLFWSVDPKVADCADGS